VRFESKSAISSVDKPVTPRLYSPHNGAPPAFRRDDAPAKHLTHRGDQTADFGRMPRFGRWLGLRRLSGSSERGDRTDLRAV